MLWLYLFQKPEARKCKGVLRPLCQRGNKCIIKFHKYIVQDYYSPRSITKSYLVSR